MNKVTFTIPAHIVRAAQLTRPKNEPRDYLNGFLVTESAVTVTNGHYLLKMPLEQKITNLHEINVDYDVIIDIDATIGKTDRFVVFTIDDKQVDVEIIGKKTKLARGKLCNKAYIKNTDRIINPTDEYASDIPVGIDSKYLTLMANAFDTSIALQTSHNKLYMRPDGKKWHSGTKAVIMQVRLDDDANIIPSVPVIAEPSSFDLRVVR